MAIKYNANYLETMPFSDVCVQFNLASAVAQTYTVPGSDTTFYQAYFEYASNANVFVCNNGTAAAPVGGTKTTTQYSEFKPKKRYVRGGDVLSLVTPDTNAYVGVSLREIQGS
jgi:hypothetical protein